MKEMKQIIGIICLALLVSSCGKPPPAKTSTNPEPPVTGRETWVINGTNYSIEGTAMLIMGNGTSLFVVKGLCDFAPDASHEPLARRLAKYAVDHGYHAKVKQTVWNGQTIPFSGNIGVALMQQRSVGSVAMNAGYRYNFNVDELTKKEN